MPDRVRALVSLDAEGDEFLITLDYQTGLYSPAGAEALLEAFAAMLEAVAGDSEARSGDIAFPQDCRIPVIALEPNLTPSPTTPRRYPPPPWRPVHRRSGRPGARFLVRPVRLAGQGRLRALPQVVQQLLDPDAVFGTAGARVNAVLLRWEDGVRHLGHDPRVLADAAHRPARFDAVVRDLETALGDLHAALLSHRTWCRTPLLLAVCPASPGWSAEPWATLERGLTARLTRLAASLPAVRVLDVGPVAGRYPVDRRDDEHADRLAHMPYTPEFTTVLATVWPAPS